MFLDYIKKKQLKTEQLEILRIFMTMKEKIIINQYEWLNFGVTIVFIINIKAIEKHYQLKNILIKSIHTSKMS